MRKLALALIMVTQLVPAPALARERMLNPTDEWSLRTDEEYCALVRNFADGAGKSVRLQMQDFGSPATLKFTMVGDGLPLRDRRRGVANFRVRFQPDPQWRSVPGTTGYVDELDALTFSTNLASAQEAERAQRAIAQGGEPEGWPDYLRDRAAEVNQLALAYPSRDDTVLQLGSMAEPLAQLTECANRLPGNWGYEPAQLARMERAPRLTNGSEVATAVLQAMLRARVGHNDAIHIRMDVDAQGKPTGCTVQQPRRGSEVEAVICQTVLESARLEPAVDTEGTPAPAPYVTWISFGIG